MSEHVLAFMARLANSLRDRWRAAVGLRVCCGLTLALLSCGEVFSQPSSLPREDFWVPDGEVRAVVEANGVVYVGGIFDYVSPLSETGSAFDLDSGAPLLDFPKINGAIKSIVT